MMGLEEIKAANAAASEVPTKRDVVNDLCFTLTVLERIAGAVSVEAARNLAAGAIETLARSRGITDGEEPIADAA